MQFVVNLLEVAEKIHFFSTTALRMALQRALENLD